MEDRNQVFEENGQLGHGVVDAERQVKLAGTFLEYGLRVESSQPGLPTKRQLYR